MRRVNQLLPVDSESYSEVEDVNSVAPEDGVQKSQHHSEDSHSHSQVLEVNVVDFAEVADESGPKFIGSHAESYAENRAEGTSGIPYLAKGKYKAFSEDEGPSGEVADNAQIELDYKVALELEQRLNDEHRQMRKLKKKTRQMARKLQELRASNIAREGSQSMPGVHKSKTPISLSDKAGRASSRLPAKSGLWRVMQGYGNRDSDLSSSSSTASESGGMQKAEREHDRAKDATESGWSSDENIFHQEPELDHSSDSDATKRRKREKRRRHRAKMNELKYHQSFLKNDPPFKYNGEVQASTFKKWCQEIRDWIKDGRLGNRRGIRQSGKYLTGRAYKFFEQDILQKGKKYSLTEYFAALFDYIFPADFRMQQRDKFDLYYQGNLSVVDYLRRLQDLADTVGDLNDNDVVLAFWRRCQPYLRSELTRTGYEPSVLTVIELETLATRIEHAEDASRDV